MVKFLSFRKINNLGNMALFFLNTVYLFILDCAGSSLLCERFSSCGALVFHCNSLSCFGARALEHVGSVVVAPGL